MDSTALLIEKINSLPENIQKQVLEFIDFLIYKHQLNQQEQGDGQDVFLTEAGKVFLEERHKAALAKPGRKWAEVKADIWAKNGF